MPGMPRASSVARCQFGLPLQGRKCPYCIGPGWEKRHWAGPHDRPAVAIRKSDPCGLSPVTLKSDSPSTPRIDNLSGIAQCLVARYTHRVLNQAESRKSLMSCLGCACFARTCDFRRQLLADL